MQDAAVTDPHAYESFNAFFTRALRDGTRPLPAAADALACPVDGTVSEAGRIEGGRLLQAKGRHYTLEALLAGRQRLGRPFRRRALRDHLSRALQLPPHPHGRGRPPARGLVRARAPVQREPGDRRRRRPAVRAQRARGLRVRGSAGRPRPGDGRRAERRQHGHRLARRGRAARAARRHAARAAPARARRSNSNAARSSVASTWAPP